MRGSTFPDDMNNRDFCIKALMTFGSYMHESSPRYQQDALDLHIPTGSSAFVAWSIFNLMLEDSYTNFRLDPSGDDWVIASVSAW